MLKWLLGKSRSNVKLPSDFKDRIDPDALQIVAKLQEAGFESYLVGGCVRDLLLKKQPKDFDIATSASPQQVKALIHRSFIIGRRFRIVIAKRRALRGWPQVSKSQLEFDKLFPLFTHHQADREIQITTFRREPVLHEGVLNENVFGSSKEDAHRRDFTLNALFLDPVSANIVDFVGGLKDLKGGKLEIIGDPYVRFKEDPIRILRAVRFMARAKLALGKKTQAGLVASIPLLANSKRERIREEILKILREGHAHEISDFLKRHKVWEIIAPEYSKHLSASKTFPIEPIFAEISKHSWKHATQTPYFFLFLLPLKAQMNFSGRTKERDFTETLIQELKVSKAEWDGMRRIESTLFRLSRDIEAKQPGRLLSRGQLRHYVPLAQSFYCLWILGLARIGNYAKIWKNWESHWRAYAREASRIPNESRRKPRSNRRPNRGTHHNSGGGAQRSQSSAASASPGDESSSLKSSRGFFSGSDSSGGDFGPA